MILGTAGTWTTQDRPGARPHRGGHRPAGGGEAPGPDHRAGLCPPHPAQWRAAERHRRARPREVHPHHAPPAAAGWTWRSSSSPPTRGPCPRPGSTWPSSPCWGCAPGWWPSQGRPGERSGVREQAAALVRGTFLDGAPVVAVSAVTGRGLPELLAALEQQAAAPAAPAPSGAPRCTWTGCSPWRAAARWSPAPSPAAPWQGARPWSCGRGRSPSGCGAGAPRRPGGGAAPRRAGRR